MTKQKKQSTEAAGREIRRRTRRKFAPEEKIRIVLEGLRGEQSVSELCRREGIAANLYYRWSKEFLEAGKKRLLGDTQPLSDPPTRVVMMVAMGRLYGSGDPDGLGLNALFEAFRSVLAADAALLVASEG